MKTDRLLIRQVNYDDAKCIAAWKNDSLIRKMSVGSQTLINEQNQLDDIKYTLTDQDQSYYVVCLKENQDPIGYIRINWLDKDKRFAWLRFGMGEMRGKGYAQEALKAVIEECLNFGCHRIDAEVYAYNTVSLHILKKLGFIQEGCKKEAHFDHGVYSDVVVLGYVKR